MYQSRNLDRCRYCQYNELTWNQKAVISGNFVLHDREFSHVGVQWSTLSLCIMRGKHRQNSVPETTYKIRFMIL